MVLSRSLRVRASYGDGQRNARTNDVNIPALPALVRHPTKEPRRDPSRSRDESASTLPVSTLPGSRGSTRGTTRTPRASSRVRAGLDLLDQRGGGLARTRPSTTSSREPRTVRLRARTLRHVSAGTPHRAYASTSSRATARSIRDAARANSRTSLAEILVPPGLISITRSRRLALRVIFVTLPAVHVGQFHKSRRPSRRVRHIGNEPTAPQTTQRTLHAILYPGPRKLGLRTRRCKQRL